jgi:Sec7-like guanine-nucleotide exchange factor
MRELLESFRLPGEAQQISRITETFASSYYASGPGDWSPGSRLPVLIEFPPAEVKSQDAVYILAYSVIMLNTDLHNPQIRVKRSLLGAWMPDLSGFQKRMSIEDYQRNLRGVNDNTDFSPEYLVRHLMSPFVLSHHPDSKAFMTLSVNVRLSCPRSTLDSLALSTLGKNFLHVHDNPV